MALSRAQRSSGQAYGSFAFFALVQSLALSLVVSWPAALDPVGVVVGSPSTDTAKHVWNLWWFRTTVLRDGALPLHTEYLNFPQGMTLWPIEPLNGIVATLLFPLPVVLVSNLLVVLNLVATGFCAILLGREVSGSRLGGLLAGFVLQTSSFALSSIYLGMGELQHLWLLPLGFFLLVRTARSLAWRYALATGLVLGLGTLACFYYGMFLAVGLSVLACCLLLSRSGFRPRLGRLALAGAIGALIALPVLWGFAKSYGPSSQTVSRQQAPRIQDKISMDLPRSLARPSAMLVEWAPEEPRGHYSGGRLMGAPVLLLALAALLRRPRRALPWWVLAALGLLLASGAGLGGPFRAMNLLAHSFGLRVHFPSRFLSLVHVSLAALASLAVAGTGARLRWAALGVVALGFVHVRVRALLPPMPSFELPQLTCLEGLESDGAVLDLAGHWWRDRQTRSSVSAAQMAHERPIQAIPLDRLASFARDGAAFAGSLELVVDAASAVGKSGEDYRPDRFVLREAGFSHVLAHSKRGQGPPPATLLSFLAAALGPPTQSCDGLALFEVPPVEVTEEQASAWRKDHQLRLLRAKRELERGVAPGPTFRGGPSLPARRVRRPSRGERDLGGERR